MLVEFIEKSAFNWPRIIVLLDNKCRKEEAINTGKINRPVTHLTTCWFREVTTSNLDEKLSFSQVSISFQQFMNTGKRHYDFQIRNTSLTLRQKAHIINKL